MVTEEPARGTGAGFRVLGANMPCSGCADRRRALGEALKAIRVLEPVTAAQQVKAAVRSFSDDAKSFARGLKVRAVKR